MSEPVKRARRVRIRSTGPATKPHRYADLGLYPVRVTGLGAAKVREIRINPIRPGEPITAWIEVFDVDVDIDLDPKIRLVALADMEAEAATASLRPMGTGRGFRLGPPGSPAP